MNRPPRRGGMGEREIREDMERGRREREGREQEPDATSGAERDRGDRKGGK